MDVPPPPLAESWSAVCRALESEGHRAIALRQLLTSSVRAVDHLAAPLVHYTWHFELLAMLEKVETLRRVLDGILSSLRRGDYYDVDALRSAALAKIGRRSDMARFLALVHEFTAPPDAARPVRTAIPLFECHVAGTTFRSLDRVLHADGSVAVEAAEDELAPGDELHFEREPSNRHDPNAVRVLTTSTGRWLGYVPRARSDVVAALLEAGKEVGGIVESVHRHRHGWLEVRMTVCLFEQTMPAARIEAKLEASEGELKPT
mgnify:CR=1 FL=1